MWDQPWASRPRDVQKTEIITNRSILFSTIPIRTLLHSLFISKYNSSAYDPADSNTLRYGTGYTSQFCMVTNLTFKTDSPVYTVSIETNCTWVSPRTTHISTTNSAPLLNKKLKLEILKHQPTSELKKLLMELY